MQASNKLKRFDKEYKNNISKCTVVQSTTTPYFFSNRQRESIRGSCKIIFIRWYPVNNTFAAFSYDTAYEIARCIVEGIRQNKLGADCEGASGQYKIEGSSG